MKRRMLDILVCPFDKESKLELFELGSNAHPKDEEKINRNLGQESSDGHQQNKSCQKRDNMESISDHHDYEEEKKNKIDAYSDDLFADAELDIVIEEGILFCNRCLRFFPIVEEIPIILPDEIRDKNKDLELLKKWSSSLPDKVVKKALPWHL
jgi:uncharacterized protein YbaR (Trm112 family)